MSIISTTKLKKEPRQFTFSERHILMSMRNEKLINTERKLQSFSPNEEKTDSFLSTQSGKKPAHHFTLFPMDDLNDSDNESSNEEKSPLAQTFDSSLAATTWYKPDKSFVKEKCALHKRRMNPPFFPLDDFIKP